MSAHSYSFDPTPDIPPCTHTLRVNKRNDLLIQSCTSVIQQAASSYNNIALWRSPERTGKCCLCASTGRGGAGRGGVCTAPTTDGTGMEEGGWERAGGRGRGGAGFKGAVVHLQVSPLGLTRCESLLKDSMGHESVTWTTWRGWIRVKRDRLPCCKKKKKSQRCLQCFSPWK